MVNEPVSFLNAKKLQKKLKNYAAKKEQRLRS